MDKIQRRLLLIRSDMAELESEANDLMKDKSASRVEYEDTIERFQELEISYIKEANSLLDTVSAEDTETECKKITADRKVMRTMIRTLKKRTPEDRGSGADKHKPGATNARTTKVKMPTLPLAEFNGDILKFRTFWDQFRCAVHDNPDFEPVQKFLYLKKTIEKSELASSVISGYEITDANYALAVESLKRRFGRKRVVVFALVKSILSMTSSGKSIKQLREFHDLLHGRVRSLSACEVDVDNDDAKMILLPMLEQKLRPDLREEWELEIADLEDRKLSVDYYFKFVDKQISAKEATSRLSYTPARGTEPLSDLNADSHPFEMPQSISSAAALVGTGTLEEPATGVYTLIGSQRNGQQPTRQDGPQRRHDSAAPPGFQGQGQPWTRNPPPPPYWNNDNASQPTVSCTYCNGQHGTTTCQQLKKLSVLERWSWAEQRRLCYNCLAPTNARHTSGSCRKPSCTAEGCGKKHHRLLHMASGPLHMYTGHTETEPLNSLLQSGVAVAECGSTRVYVRLLFDSGSQRSYVRSAVANVLGLSGVDERLTISTLGGRSETKTLQNVRLTLHHRNNAASRVELNALAIEKICAPLEAVNVNTSAPHLCELELADEYPRPKVSVDILVGLDHYYDIVHGGKCRRGPAGSPVAISSKFGWILCGPAGSAGDLSTALLASTRLSASDSNDKLQSALARFWELENLDCHPTTTESDATSDDQIALQHFENHVTFDGTRYIVSIPWKPDVHSMKSNYHVSLKCLQSMERQLLTGRDRHRATDYTTAIEQYMEDGIAEEVGFENRIPESVGENYFSHHAVYREDKTTTKTRIVMNGSLRNSDGKSLNDFIFPGPALQPDLFGILIRFRTRHIGITADIRKMFLQIKLRQQDQDTHRFLWRGLDLSAPPRVFRMTRVTFGVNCSPFLAIATVQHHARTQQSLYPQAAKEVMTNMFVDDCITGCNSLESGVHLVNELRALMSTGGFELTKWASNSQALMDRIPETQRNPALPRNASDEGSLKVLGIKWNNSKDFLSLDVESVLNSENAPSKRAVLSTISKIYDPLGFAAPFVITAKLLMQDIWRCKTNWDSDIDSSCVEKWSVWKKEVQLIRNLEVPRQLPMPHPEGSLELHGFSDASPKAYGATVYVRAETKPGMFKTGLVMSKSRVAPTRPVTLPRLELLGAELACNLTKFVENQIHQSVSSIYLWTDSLVTYFWIQKPPQALKTFVANRVERIQGVYGCSAWRYCPGESNPSDLVTRGVSASTLLQSELWWTGPAWLRQPEAEWPTTPHHTKDEIAETLTEVKPQNQIAALTTSSTPQTTSAQTQEDGEPVIVTYLDAIIDPTNFSTWIRLLRVTATVLIAINKFRDNGSKPQPPYLTVELLNKTEEYWIKTMQKARMTTTLRNLRTEEPLPANDPCAKLDPYIDASGIIRVGGRLQKTDLPEDSKHPIILPHHDWVSGLIVEDVHRNATHVGPDGTHAILRERFWLLRGKSELKRILHKCLVCRRTTARPAEQKMAPLPKERVTPGSAFSSVGVDFAGPLYTRVSLNTPEKSTSKSYICLFTCAASRMIHLELCGDLSTSEFLQAFRRMANRRGLCHTIFSDNALTFKASDKIFRLHFSPENKRKLNCHQISQYFATRKINWKFISERAPWQGGFWERMVRSVKTCLRRVLGKALLTPTELATVLTDIEAVVNSRPLTTISSDIDDPSPLTPAHLAIGRALLTVPDAAAPDVLPKHLSRRYAYQKRLVSNYWSRWKKEYLPLLTVRRKWTVEKPPLNVGDVCLMSDDGVPRGQWPLARVEEILAGDDGLVRNVRVRTAKGTYTRPVQRLHLLEQATDDMMD